MTRKVTVQLLMPNCFAGTPEVAGGVLGSLSVLGRRSVFGQ